MNTDRQNALRLLPFINHQRTEETASWQSICIALKNCGVPYEIFEQWSLTGKYHDRNQIRRAWKNLHGRHTLGTLCHYVRQDSGRVPRLDQRPEHGFDGETAFDTIIAPFSEYSEADLDAELWERSPFRLNEEPGAFDLTSLLEMLYDPDDQIFIGQVRADPDSQRRSIRTVREHLRSPVMAEFFRPNPLTGTAIIRNGKPSYVSDGCVAGFRYAVVEFDGESLRRQYAFYLAMLEKNFPIAALTFSGNKSIHCLLAVNCVDADEWKTKVEEQLFRNYLEPLGCDGACKNEGRSSRTPGAIRSNGRCQRLLYLNPELKGK